MPEIVGAWLVGAAAVTAMENAVSDALAWPSLTLIRTFEKDPVEAGVPESLPVEALKLAQAGLFWTLKLSAFPSGSVAVGWKL